MPRDRLAHGTYRQLKRYAGVVSSSLTRSSKHFKISYLTKNEITTEHTIAMGFEPTPVSGLIHRIKNGKKGIDKMKI